MKVHKQLQIIDTNIPNKFKGKVYLALVEVENLKDASSKMITTISDQSWLKELDFIDQYSFEHTVNKTSDKLIEIFNSIENEITKEFGQYLISLTAQDSLEKIHFHKIFPLPELWKEKVSGNPGFDFHTKSQCENIVFGEAKYQDKKNAYWSAINQTLDFSVSTKEVYDFSFLGKLIKEDLIKQDIIKKHKDGYRAYAISFSFNYENIESISENIKSNKDLIELSKITDLLYLIGVCYEPQK